MYNSFNERVYNPERNTKASLHPVGCQYKHTRYYHNSSHGVITITERSNIRIDVSPGGSVNCAEGYLFVRDIYEFSTMAGPSTLIASLENRLAVLGNSYQGDLRIIVATLKAMTDGTYLTSNTFPIMVERAVPANDIREFQNIYLRESDVVITAQGANPSEHPDSSIARMHGGVKKMADGYRGGGVFVEIVDNNKEIDTRFLYVGGRVITIRPVTDITRNNGVYFTSVESNRLAENNPETEFCLLSEAADKFGIHDTQEKAITAGNPGLIMEQELVSLKHELEVGRMNAAKEKQEREALIEEMRHKHAIALAERDKQLKKMNHRLEKFKIDSAEKKEKIEVRKSERNDHYEERAAVRKDSSELIKWVPAIVAGTAAIIALASKK